MTTKLTSHPSEPVTPIHLERIAAAVNSHPEGEDRCARHRDLPVPVTATVDRDVPAASLLDLSAATDLLVIGSRRWGPLARLLLGGTGEALVHGAQCSVLIVPRPDTES
jgi:nucleotide-binding universal stress UspA family protein